MLFLKTFFNMGQSVKIMLNNRLHSDDFPPLRCSNPAYEPGVVQIKVLLMILYA